MVARCLLVLVLLTSTVKGQDLVEGLGELLEDVGDLLGGLLGGGGGGNDCPYGDDEGGGGLNVDLGDLLQLTVGGDKLLELDLLDNTVSVDIDLNLGGGGSSRGSNCYDVQRIDFSLNDAYCEQPYFVTFVTKTDSNCLIDNVCYTLFPLPDDPNTFNLYRSTVFADGSYRINTAVVTDLQIGRSRAADPYCTFSQNVIGYAGCDTYVIYRCMEFGDCAQDCDLSIIGLSSTCVPLGLSCLEKIDDIVEKAKIPKTDYVILPMKLPSRCITEQICINNIQGNFYRALNIKAPVSAAILL